MKAALVGIAKDEDKYIDEWITYHLNLGFDSVFLVQNKWRYSGQYKNHPRVHLVVDDGDARQVHVYNDFIQNMSMDYTHAAFFDIDEFLVPLVDKNLEEFLSRYDDDYGVHVNWRLFGDNGLSGSGQYDDLVLPRFTKRQIGFNHHIKTILNFRNARRDLVRFLNPHFTNLETVDTNRIRSVFGPYDYDPIYPIAQLNHYFCKTREEFIEKMKRGKADTAPSHPNYSRKMYEFDIHNKNEIVDTRAKDLWEAWTK